MGERPRVGDVRVDDEADEVPRRTLGDDALEGRLADVVHGRIDVDVAGHAGLERVRTRSGVAAPREQSTLDSLDMVRGARADTVPLAGSDNTVPQLDAT